VQMSEHKKARYAIFHNNFRIFPNLWAFI
jgi:hypothetical protein